MSFLVLCLSICRTFTSFPWPHGGARVILSISLIWFKYCEVKTVIGCFFLLPVCSCRGQPMQGSRHTILIWIQPLTYHRISSFYKISKIHHYNLIPIWFWLSGHMWLVTCHWSCDCLELRIYSNENSKISWLRQAYLNGLTPYFLI